MPAMRRGFEKPGQLTASAVALATSPSSAVTTPHFDFERAAMAGGFRWVAGVDEAGRGPLAGPVGVAAVILDSDDLPEGVDDSKALSQARREELREVILAKALSVSVAFASVEEIDSHNIRGATLRAMARAIAALSLRPDLALIDGRDTPDGLICPARPIVGGDGISISIAAASIIAKTSRDALMRNLGREYPQYGFDDHVGYATAPHRRAIALSGPCPYHRRTFHLTMKAD